MSGTGAPDVHAAMEHAKLRSESHPPHRSDPFGAHAEQPPSNAVLDRNTSKSARFCACSREPYALEVADVERSAVLRVERLDRSQSVDTPCERAAVRDDSGRLAPWSAPLMLIRSK